MPNLYDILESASEGAAIGTLGREFGLAPEQTQSAIAALLPAISAALKKSTSTVEGLGNLFALMGQQEALPALYDDAKLAASPEGLAAGNQAVALIFGAPAARRSIIDHAQRVSGVSASNLDKLLPAITGIILSGLLRSSPSESVPGRAQAAVSRFGEGGALGDILGQVLGRVLTGGSGPAPAPAPSSGGAGPLGDILGQIFGRGAPEPSGPSAGPSPQGSPFPIPADTGGGQGGPGDLLGTIMREVLKGIQNGTIKPVIIGGGGPIQFPMPGGPDGSGAPQIPGGDIFGKILRDVLGGALGGGGSGGSVQLPQGGPAPSPGQAQAPTPPMKDLSDLTRQLGVMGGAGAAVFGDRFDHGQDVDESHLNHIHGILNSTHGA